MLSPMFQVPTNRKQFVVICKRCHRDFPCRGERIPFSAIAVVCCLCGEKRRYLPSEVFLGKPDHFLAHQTKSGAN
jgi:RNase P subunit RPR2